MRRVIIRVLYLVAWVTFIVGAFSQEVLGWKCLILVGLSGLYIALYEIANGREWF